ncbi:MAG: hypothetical protein SFX73_07440 [Kofleriaceae bacterium]|nr:hypothetical protein [Kofleriaceae bacterium]
MRSRLNSFSWLGPLLTLFMVLVLPSCWYGTLQRAVAPQDIPANANEEEREEVENEQTQEEIARRTSPPPLPEAPLHSSKTPTTPAARKTERLASVAPPVHPSLYSVRRLQ